MGRLPVMAAAVRFPNLVITQVLPWRPTICAPLRPVWGMIGIQT